MTAEGLLILWAAFFAIALLWMLFAIKDDSRKKLNALLAEAIDDLRCREHKAMDAVIEEQGKASRLAAEVVRLKRRVAELDG